MIHTINITTRTRNGDAYSEVAINEYPIIYVDDENVEDILDDEELIAIINKYIKNQTTYNSAILKIKSLTDDLSDVTTSEFRLKDYIKLDNWS